MKNWLTNATKKRVIRELKGILRDHPRYKDDSENVTNKYSFSDRPRRGIIVNGTSADRVRLSADNYIGRINSFVMLAPIDNHPGTSIEWVTENLFYLEKFSKKRDVFPTAPGIYVIEIKKLPDEARDVPGEFTIDPIIDVTNEPLITFVSSADFDAQLPSQNIYPGSTRLWLDGKRSLVEDIDYSINNETGEIRFLRDTPSGSIIYADYRYTTPTMGPFFFRKEEFNVDAVPGATIAFGERCQLGDKIAVVVYSDRDETADVYGGKFEVSFDLLVFTHDSDDRERMSDYVTTKFIEIQNRLGFEGLELVDVSPGSEAEEVRNEATGEYFYDTTINVTLRVDWEVYYPLPVIISRAEMTSKSAESTYGYLDGTYPLDLVRTIRPADLASLPTFVGKELTYERIR